MRFLQQLIEQEVYKVLRETSYTEADVPKHFWLVTDIDPNRPENSQQLVAGELHGVKGISASKQILIEFLGIARNAVLIMPAKKFLEVNNVSRVMYENPHYLVSKNLAAIFRLSNKSQDQDYDWATVSELLMDYMKLAQKQMKLSEDFGTIMYYVDYGTLSPTWFGKIFMETKPHINTVKELSAWFKNTSIEVATQRSKSLTENAKSVEVGEWQQLLFAALTRLGKVYKSESEWLVKDDSLTIPQGSTLLVELDTMPKDISDEAKEIYNNPDSAGIIMGRTRDEIKQLGFIDYVKSLNLDQRYNFKFISKKKFDAYRSKLWSKK